MSGETAGERQKEGDQDHRQSHDGEADVRDEQGEVERAEPNLGPGNACRRGGRDW